jgi:long-subunit fatty acid transport protein
MGGFKMKRLSILCALLLCVFALGFSQIGTNIFAGFNWGLSTNESTPGVLTGAASAVHTIDFGLLVDYEVAEGFSIGAGVGGAIPLTSGIVVTAVDGANSTELKYFLDGLLGISYMYPLPPVVLKADVLGGISFFDLTRLGEFGFLVKAKFSLGYTIGQFTISVGAGYEMRQYSVKPESGGNAKITFSSIPIELGVTVRF